MRSASGIRDIFNLHYDNIISGASPGLNDYEVSLYLTQAHREVIYNYYAGNDKGDSFDSSEKVRAYLSYYTKGKTYTGASLVAPTNPPTSDLIYRDCDLDIEIWWIVKEDITIGNRRVLVKPITQDDFWVLIEDPFKKPNGLRAWKLDASTTSKRTSRLISSVNFTAYTVTYLIKPDVVVLSDLSDLLPGLEIEGVSTESIPQSLLNNELLMDQVINRAVELATRDYKQNNLETQVQINNRAE